MADPIFDTSIAELAFALIVVLIVVLAAVLIGFWIVDHITLHRLRRR